MIISLALLVIILVVWLAIKCSACKPKEEKLILLWTKKNLIVEIFDKTI